MPDSSADMIIQTVLIQKIFFKCFFVDVLFHFSFLFLSEKLKTAQQGKNREAKTRLRLVQQIKTYVEKKGAGRQSTRKNGRSLSLRWQLKVKILLHFEVQARGASGVIHQNKMLINTRNSFLYWERHRLSFVFASCPCASVRGMTWGHKQSFRSSVIQQNTGVILVAASVTNDLTTTIWEFHSSYF